MELNHPNNPWARYADDGIAHCKTLEEAEHLLEKLKVRFEECKLQVHPDKTRIVYCKIVKSFHIVMPANMAMVAAMVLHRGKIITQI